jgi:hypothetical protein
MFLTKYHPATGVATFLGPVYVDWPMLQSISPESRDFIRLVVVIPSLVCLAIGKFMGGFQFRQIYTFFLQGEINIWEGAGSMDLWQINLGKLLPY